VDEGYTLVLDGTLDGECVDELRAGVGPKAQQKHEFAISDEVSEPAVPVPDPRAEWATHYKVSELQPVRRETGEQYAIPGPEGDIASTWPGCRSYGHRRLGKRT